MPRNNFRISDIARNKKVELVVITYYRTNLNKHITVWHSAHSHEMLFQLSKHYDAGKYNINRYCSESLSAILEEVVLS